MQKLILFLAFSIFSIQMSQAHNGPSTITTTTLNVDDTNCQLTSPGNFYPVTIGAHNVVLHYDDVPGAIGYDIRAYIGGTQYGSPAFAPYGAVTYDFGGLPSGTTIEFRIRSICGNGEIGDIYTPTTATTVIIELIAALNYSCPDPGTDVTTVNFNSGETSGGFPWTNANLTTYWGELYYNGAKTLVFRIELSGITSSAAPKVGLLTSESSSSDLCVMYLNNCIYEHTGDYIRMTEAGNGIVGNFTIAKNPNANFGYIEFSNIQQPEYHTFKIKSRNCPPPIKPHDDEESSLPTGSVNNPFHDLLIYNSEILTEDDVTLSLMDMNGRILRSQKMAGGQDQYSLQTADITPGMYVLRVQTGKQVKVMQVVKTN